MAITVADLQVKATSDVSGAESGLNRLNTEVSKAPGFFNRAASTMTGFIAATGAMRLAGAAWDFAGESIIGFNSLMEQSKIGFTTMLGSGEKAEAFLKDLQKFAETTPFRFEGLVQSSQRLLAMGFAADEIKPVLTSVGDAMAALGQGDAGIDRATYALGQMRSAGRVTAQDMMQLTSLGIPAWDILAQHAGKTVAQTRELAEKGAIDAETAVTALTQGMTERFGGLMAGQAKTWQGATSTILDSAQSMIANAFKPLFEQGSKALQGLASWLTSPAAAQFGKNISEGINTAMEAIGGFIEALGQGPAAIGEWVQSMLGGVGEFTSTFGTALLRGIQDFIGQLTTMIGPATEQLLAFLTGMVDWVLNEGVPMMAEAIGPLALKFIDWIVPMIPPLLIELGKVAIAILGWILQTIPKIAAKLVEWGFALSKWVLTEALPRLIPALIKLGGELLGWIIGMIPKVAGMMLEFAGKMVGVFIDYLGRLPGLLGDVLGLVLGTLGRWIGDMIGKAGKGASSVIDTVIDWFKKLPGMVMDAIFKLPGMLVDFLRNMIGRVGAAAGNIGKGIIEGIWNGISGMAGWLWDKVSGFVGDTVDNVLGFLGIHSPSRVFAGIGEQMIAGLAKGILDSAPRADAALERTLDRMTGAALMGPQVAQMASPALAAAAGGAPPAFGGLGGGVTITMYVDRFMGREDEAAYYSDLMARQIRMTGST